MSELLTRDEFRVQVASRSCYGCVICGRDEGLSVHHIIERKLWPDGGYYVENGAALCDTCHLNAEKTILSCDDIRAAAKIEKVLLPPGLEPDFRYDKWANIIHEDGSRTKGPMFHDEGCLKILKAANLLHIFR